MNRAVWFAAGAGAAIYAMVRGRRAAEAFTTGGLQDRWQAIGVGARILRDEVAQGRAEKETELRRRIVERQGHDPTKRIGTTSPASAILGARPPVDEEGSTT